MKHFDVGSETAKLEENKESNSLTLVLAMIFFSMKAGQQKQIYE